ncbi:hypothetical protein [Parasitella parasitica]|uniref:Uncharacterized protein n=1 Tax=Parasitella parasitica TaxID=35722 RepID=A0A0B7NQ50_9FUNG|nr:hypothetical protein [Parasitella parasitica]
MSLTLVCKQYKFIALKQQVGTPFEFSTSRALSSLSLPSHMATNITINCLSTAEEAYFQAVTKIFTNCHSITVNFNGLLSWKLTRKICRTIVKTGLYLHVLNSSNPTKVAKFLHKAVEKYKKQHEDYVEKQGKSVKRKRPEEDFIMLKIPRNTDNRRDFLLKHLLSLSTLSNLDANFTSFARITNITSYKEAKSNILFFTSGTEEIITHAERFVNCIVTFEAFSLLVTSYDIFYHNNRFEDDCAHSLDSIFQVPTAKVTRKTYTNKAFTEISIFIGHYEFLVVSGFLNRNGTLMPFLGSSMHKFNLREEVSTRIDVPTTASPNVRTIRLLSQFVKRRSHELWGIHCLRSYLQGFYPISAVSFSNHLSQKHKQINNQHFTSQVLHLISNELVIKTQHLTSLWSLLQRMAIFKKMTKNAGTTPTNFSQLSQHLRQENEKSAFASINRLLASIEGKVPCFFLSMYTEAEAKKVALGIMEGGLREKINKQHDQILESAKKQL